MFEMFKPKAKKEETPGNPTEEVVGSIPTEFVVEKDGRTEHTKGEITVLYDPDLESEEKSGE